LQELQGVLYEAVRAKKLAITGMHAFVRHPQYLAFILIMIGFLIQWPTILTLIMFPLLVWRYIVLAKEEEADVKKIFGKTIEEYAARTPAFFPKFSRGPEK